METTEQRGRAKLTHADYLLFPDDGKRHELIDGEHYVTPSPRLRHQQVVQNLSLEIGLCVRKRQLGRLFVAPLDVILSDHDVVEPDLLFVSHAKSAILQDWVRGAPDLVIEILSPTTRHRDQTVKLDLYERRQISEYWIVDPEARSVTIYRLAGSRYTQPAVFSKDDARLSTPLLPGLELPLHRVFEGI
jgi:Uma2 family endonuclease